MTDIILGFIILALLGYIAWERVQSRKEQSKLINAIVSKTPEQLRDLEFVEKVSVEVKKPETPDLVPIEQITDEQFAEQVGKET